MLAFSDFPAPLRLMLLGVRLRPDAEDLARIETLAGGELDWRRFLQASRHHRLSSLVFFGLDGKAAGMPAWVRKELQTDAKVNAFAALRSTHEICRITAELETGGFPSAVLKGVPLSQLLYGNPSTRHVGDLDLLTRPLRLLEQVDLLAGLGYRRINPACHLTPHRLDSYTTFWKDFTFKNPQSGFELDLHWRLFNNRFHPANRILAQSRYVTVKTFGCEMRVFSPRDQFIYIAAHGISDAWIYLKSLADVAGFLNLFSAEELDDALARAEEIGLIAQLSGAIHLANAWMGCGVTNQRLLPADEPTSRQIQERTVTMLLRHNFQPERNHPSPAEWLELERKLVPGFRSKLEMARRFVWRPRVWTSIDLPDRLFWIYPLIGLFLPPRPHAEK